MIYRKSIENFRYEINFFPFMFDRIQLIWKIYGGLQFLTKIVKNFLIVYFLIDSIKTINYFSMRKHRARELIFE